MKYQELKALAEKAVNGPWAYNDIETNEVHTTCHHEFLVCNTEEISDAQFIAAANPAVILEMIAEIERLAVCLNTTKNDYWFMSSLLERSSSNHLQEAVNDCIDRMKFRKAFFNSTDQLESLSKKLTFAENTFQSLVDRYYDLPAEQRMNTTRKEHHSSIISRMALETLRGDK